VRDLHVFAVANRCASIVGIHITEQREDEDEFSAWVGVGWLESMPEMTWRAKNNRGPVCCDGFPDRVEVSPDVREKDFVDCGCPFGLHVDSRWDFGHESIQRGPPHDVFDDFEAHWFDLVGFPLIALACHLAMATDARAKAAWRFSMSLANRGCISRASTAAMCAPRRVGSWDRLFSSLVPPVASIRTQLRFWIVARISLIVIFGCFDLLLTGLDCHSWAVESMAYSLFISVP
jgi:hypothetical protein